MAVAAQNEGFLALEQAEEVFLLVGELGREEQNPFFGNG